MHAKALFVGLVVVAALVSVHLSVPHHPISQRSLDDEVAWPMSFEGQELKRLPLSDVDQRFADRFPGRLARFTDGRRIITTRVIREPTPMLHSAAVCFRGVGYRVETPHAVRDANGLIWSCFGAERDGERYHVCERIYDLQGGAWTDASSWYWAAMLGRTKRPWYAVTVVSAR